MKRTRHAGFTLVELLIVVALIGILAALCAPFLMAAKASANEASALGSLKALNSAQAAFSTTCGGGGYSSTIPNLISMQYLDQDLALAPKSGFVVALAVGWGGMMGIPDCGGTQTLTVYYSSATPVTAPMARRAFASNQSGTIWEDRTGVPPPEPFTPSATVSPVQ
jgi:type IV pilus assembly protein PilA